MINVIEYDEIGEILLHAVGASCIDYLVGIKAYPSYLVSKAFV